MKFWINMSLAILFTLVAVASGLAMLWIAAVFHNLWIGAAIAYTGIVGGFTLATLFMQRAERC